MNQRAVWTIVGKDLKLVRQNRNVMLPMIFVPLILFVVIPLFIVFFASNAELDSISEDLGDFGAFLDNMPLNVGDELAGLNPQQQIVILTTVYMLAPLYLIIPLLTANVIAADSFAGEKERKTLEALLYSPITERELFTAKVLVALIPAVLISVGSFVVYGLVLNIAAGQIMGRIFFPNLVWLVLVFWVAPAAAGLGLGAGVVVSSKVKTVQEAFQLGGMVVIPVVILVIGQAAGVVYLSAPLAFVIGIVLWLVDFALLWYGIKSFRRGEIIAQL